MPGISSISGSPANTAGPTTSLLPQLSAVHPSWSNAAIHPDPAQVPSSQPQAALTSGYPPMGLNGSSAMTAMPHPTQLPQQASAAGLGTTAGGQSDHPSVSVQGYYRNSRRCASIRKISEIPAVPPGLLVVPLLGKDCSGGTCPTFWGMSQCPRKLKMCAPMSEEEPV